MYADEEMFTGVQFLCARSDKFMCNKVCNLTDRIVQAFSFIAL